MRLQEVLDKIASYKWSDKKYDQWLGSFVVGDSKYMIAIEQGGGGAHGAGAGWEIIFFNISKDSEEITGSGGEFVVFATVAKMLDDFLKKVKPTKFYFSAKEPSRRKLYDRMSKLLIRKYSDYSLKKEKMRSGQGYVFKRDK